VIRYKVTAKLPDCPSCGNNELFLAFYIGIRCYKCNFKSTADQFPEYCEVIRIEEVP
jgi:uncharacterized protein (DUF983 family)